MIFSEFSRSERSIQLGYKGLGLGLAICKRLVDLHGGAIGVHSTGQAGGGSDLFLYPSHCGTAQRGYRESAPDERPG
ncbi:MAG: ATP-binding protein [Candidatus Moduliflexus flocculans]|nr:ATP-binding protein [Candidatus Moduliflexus flocculans]